MEWQGSIRHLDILCIFRTGWNISFQSQCFYCAKTLVGIKNYLMLDRGLEWLAYFLIKGYTKKIKHIAEVAWKKLVVKLIVDICYNHLVSDSVQ